MAIPRRRAYITGDRPHGLDPHVWHVLTDAECMCTDRGGIFFEDMPRLWRRHRREILRDWIARHPGTRPSFWWSIDAPEPRRRVGGHGIADFEHYPAIMPYYRMGMPVYWHEYDEDDPPVFESEREYLSRLGLLSAGE